MKHLKGHWPIPPRLHQCRWTDLEEEGYPITSHRRVLVCDVIAPGGSGLGEDESVRTDRSGQIGYPSLVGWHCVLGRPRVFESYRQ
jgi:hypothetical protein